jgi:proton-dependent oligopeptide transporter, POT family
MLAQAYFFRREFEAFRNAAERAIALNPMDACTVAFMGILLAYTDEWERGCALTRRAIELNPSHPGWYRFAEFNDAYRKKDYRGALEVVVRFNMPSYYYTHPSGALYPPEDEARRTRGFVIFSTGINIGAVAGPLLCGLLAQLYGWHFGFDIAAIFMLLGLATYLYGYHYLPARVERRKFESATRLTATERRILVALMAVMIISIFESIAYGQVVNVSSIWIQQHVALDMGGFRIPVPWFQSINSVFSIASVPLLFWIWRQQAMRGREPNELAKIGTGAFLAAASNLILVLAILLSGAAPVHPLWPFLYSAGLGISFLYYWPTLLALVSRAAPAKMNATMMGLAFMSLFIANTIIGRIGGFYEKMTPAQFWAMHAAIGAMGGLLVVLFGRRLSRVLHPARSVALKQ